MRLKTLTVTQVNNLISDYVDTNPIFSMIKVQGEVVNLKVTNYGYTFFTLKDDKCRVSCLAFYDIDVEDGQEIIVKGKVNFYQVGGTYSILVSDIEKYGKGQIRENFIKLYKKLEDKGYFLEKNKKKLKSYPKNIGVITSYRGAAIQDIISVFKRKYPIVDIYIYDTKTQGKNAEEGILNAIKTLDNMNLDVIIISRGGGDADDLTVFNSEKIADLIFNRKTPIISAIGHEIDYVITDYVADFRAPTPSVAAEISVPDIKEIYNNIDYINKQIEENYLKKINSLSLKLVEYLYKIEKNSPVILLKRYENLAENFFVKIKIVYDSLLQKYDKNLENLMLKITHNNPLKVLQSGYSMIMKDKNLVTDSAQLKDEDVLQIKFYDSYAKVRIKIEERGKYGK